LEQISGEAATCEQDSMRHFNEYGNPVPEGMITLVAVQVEALADGLFELMIAEGATVVEIRAAAQSLMGGINCSASMAILTKQSEMQKVNKSPVNSGPCVRKQKSTTRRRVV
jgi:hypothetical protein